MKRMIRLIWLLTLGLSSFCLQVHAVSFTNELSAGVWDVGGSYNETIEGLAMSYTVSQDGKGKLTGYGSAGGTAQGVSINMDFFVKGKVSSKNYVTKIKQKMSIKGVASAYGETVRFKGSLTMKTVIDEVNKVMSGTLKISLLGYKETSSYYEDISDLDMDGIAVLRTTINEIEGKLIGDAVIELSNGRLIVMEAKGKDKDGPLLITAKGLKDDADSKGSSIKVLIDQLGDLLDFKGKFLGQKLKHVEPCTSPTAEEFTNALVGKSIKKAGYKILSTNRFRWGKHEYGNWSYTKTGETTATAVFTYDYDGNNPGFYREETLLTCLGDRFLYRYSEYYYGVEDLSSISFGIIKF